MPPVSSALASAVAVDASEEERIVKVQAAKKKLRKYRSSQTSNPTPSSTLSPASRSPHHSIAIVPLSTDLISNTTHTRIPSSGKAKEEAMFGEERVTIGQAAATERAGHGRQASIGGRHRRNGSAASSSQGGFAPPGWSMPLTASSSRIAPPSSSLPKDTAAYTPQAIPTHDDPSFDPFAGPPLPPVSHGEEDPQATHQRFTSFSFGAKASTGPQPAVASSAQPARTRRQRSNLASISSLNAITASSSGNSSPSAPAVDIGTTPSRPPSLLFTAPSPLQPSTAANQRDPPSSPPTERRKRHSHTRSSSISLPNLKVGRPTSLGIPTSPSYPGSPTSPAVETTTHPRRSAPIISSRLKFEPSEAEKEKEEGRRKALEKLTGSSPLASPLMEEPEAAISLPDPEEDVTTIQAPRPLSGIYTSPSFSFGRPNSLTLPSLSSSISSIASSNAPYSWSAGEENAVATERWSFGLPKEDAFSFPGEVSKRASMTGTLAVLAEEDEAVEEEEAMSDRSEVKETRRSFSAPSGVPSDIAAEEEPAVPSPRTHQPTPSRLRELHLVSSVSGSTPSRTSSSMDSSTPGKPTSPTKAYGPIGRGRPRPLSGIIGSSTSSGTSTPPMSALVTPAASSSTRMQRRQSRGSSISYMKDGSTSSTASVPYHANRWSISSRDVVSPPPELPMKSPVSATSTSRPSPRPTSLAGLGFEVVGSARVLSKVSEKDEDPDAAATDRNREDWGLAARASQVADAYMFQSFSSGPSSGRRPSHEADSDGGFTARRDEVLEMRMERDALKEGVQAWKNRCDAAEERLDEERKENGILRERVRKLGDWLLSVSNTASTPSTAGSGPAEESRILRDLQSQLFSMTASLEQERKEKEQALARMNELEREMAVLRYEARAYPSQSGESGSTPTPDSPFVATAAGTPTRSPLASVVEIDTPTSAIMSALKPLPTGGTPDSNDQRMRAWGFPRGPVAGRKENKRESFFGLSRDLRGSPLGSVSIPRHEPESFASMGVDLPPFALPTEQVPIQDRELQGHGSIKKRAQAGLWVDASSSISISADAGALGLSTPPMPPTATSMPTVPRISISGSPSAASVHGSSSSVFTSYTPINIGGPDYRLNRNQSDDRVAEVDRAYEPPWKANQPSGRIPWYARGSSGVAPVMGVGLDMRAACRCCRGDVMEI